MIDKAPDIREYCFNEAAPLSPDMMLAVWARTYLTPDQFSQFKRMVSELKGEVAKISVEQMMIMIDVVTALY